MTYLVIQQFGGHCTGGTGEVQWSSHTIAADLAHHMPSALGYVREATAAGSPFKIRGFFSKQRFCFVRTRLQQDLGNYGVK